MKLRRWIAAAVSILLLAFIWGNSLQSGSSSTQVSMGVANALLGQAAFAWEGLLRKAAHLLEFAALGFVLFFALQPARRPAGRCTVYTLLAAAAVALCDEGIQLWVPGRSAQLTDVLIDVCGVLLGVLCARLIWYLYHKLRS